jgi:chloride channel 3/4/5
VIYATLAALFVKKFAKFAAGSGVSEVKTILSGVYIKDFLSIHTIFFKAVALV